MYMTPAAVGAANTTADAADTADAAINDAVANPSAATIRRAYEAAMVAVECARRTVACFSKSP